VVVNIIAKGTIQYYIVKYPKAKTGLLTWYHEFSKLKFHNFNELKAIYGNASVVANNRIIFNIKGNDFRLVVSVNFQKTAAYVIWFGTHAEYDKINVETISFDMNILKFKSRL
jgi:mRNA interferase HigB